MKIDSPNFIPPNAHAAPAGQRQGPASGTFSEVLGQTLEKCGGTGESRPPLNPGLCEIHFQPAEALKPFSPMDRLEGLLDLLNEYQVKLGDTGAPLKEMDPLIKRMEEEVQGLDPVLESLPESDELRGILNEALITASKEIIRFGRGEYVKS
jgi:hypothetical protein